MEVMKKEECYLLGKIIRTHGVKGDVMVFMDVDKPDRYKQLKTLWVEKNGELISFDVKKAAVHTNIATIHLEGVDDMTTAENYLKCEVYLPLSLLPELDETKFYFHEVINFKVVDRIKGEIGIFEKVLDRPQQTIAQLKNGDKEILIPMVGEFIEKVDRKEKILYLNLPEGLVDIYL